MSALKSYREMLTLFAEQTSHWQVGSEDPLTIVRDAIDGQLPLAVTLYGNDQDVHICVNLYTNEEFVNLAKSLLQILNQEKVSTRDDESGLNVLIDSDGFALIQTDKQHKDTEFSADLERLIATSEPILSKLVKDAFEVVNKQRSSNEEEVTSQNNAQQIGDDLYLPVIQAIEKYLADNGYKSRHDEDRKRFILGFNTKNYRDKDGDSSVQVHLIYDDDDLLRVSTPWLYTFDFNKVDYVTVASAIAWYQFEYKFLSMSLDPTDGELRISLDIPMADNRVHPDQIKRLINFCYQFAEDTYEELFKLLLQTPESGKEKLESLIEQYREKVSKKQWVRNLQEKLEEATDEQKRMIESILTQGQEQQEKRGI